MYLFLFMLPPLRKPKCMYSLLFLLPSLGNCSLLFMPSRLRKSMDLMSSLLFLLTLLSKSMDKEPTSPVLCCKDGKKIHFFMTWSFPPRCGCDVVAYGILWICDSLNICIELNIKCFQSNANYDLALNKFEVKF